MKARYFIHLAYNGTHYHGWQIQPDQITVQEKIETALHTVLRERISITGCGRTDTGVHASDYYAHFESVLAIDRKTIHSLNALVGADIVIFDIVRVGPDDHARYSAIERVYQYSLSLRKNPFHQETVSYVPGVKEEHLSKLNLVADMIVTHDNFESLSKKGADVSHYRCDVRYCRWRLEDANTLVMEIRANRFLRGMVRLIVGNSIRVALGKMTIDHLHTSILNQSPIPHSLSAPPQGLFLSKVNYPNPLQSILDGRI